MLISENEGRKTTEDTLAIIEGLSSNRFLEWYGAYNFPSGGGSKSTRLVLFLLLTEGYAVQKGNARNIGVATLSEIWGSRIQELNDGA